jgi:hypothetical protein
MIQSPIKFIKSLFTPRDCRIIFHKTMPLNVEIESQLASLKVITNPSDINIGDSFIEKKEKYYYVYVMTDARVPRFICKSKELMGAMYKINKYRK